jgi:hypothetical protein
MRWKMSMSLKSRISKLEQDYRKQNVHSHIASSNLDGTITFHKKTFSGWEAISEYMRSINMAFYPPIIDMNFEAEAVKDAEAAAELGMDF